MTLIAMLLAASLVGLVLYSVRPKRRPLVLAGLAGAAVLLIAGDFAYREFYVKPLGVAYLVEQFPEILSSADQTTAAPEIMILSPVALEPDCDSWIWGCYSADAYRDVAHVYVMRQHGGLNEVIPCDRASCPDGRDYSIRELSPEEWQSAGQRRNERGDIVDICRNKQTWLYGIEVCRQDSYFDNVIERSLFLLRIPHLISFRPIMDSQPMPEAAYYVNYVSNNTYLVGSAAELLKRRM